MKPKRIQRKRTKGWKMPPNTVYVGRPTRWGNPFRVNGLIDVRGHDEPITINCNLAVALYERNLRTEERLLVFIDLHGKDLACWCPLDQPCHADVLLEIANA